MNRRSLLNIATMTVFGLVALPGSAVAQQSGEHKVIPSEDIKWGPAPPFVPTGAQAAVLYGDPSKEGMFAFRLKLPKGYHIPPHTHPKPEIVTILSGTARLGMGTSADHGKAQVLPAGSFFALTQARPTISSPTTKRLSNSTAPVRGASTTSTRRMIHGRRRSSGGIIR